MISRSAAIMVAMAVIVLLASCESAEPTTLPVQATDTPLPPTSTPVAATSTIAALTPTTEPPTEVPEPTLATLPPTETPPLPLGSGGLRISIVYDNTSYDPSMLARWGFSAWLEYGEHTVLFDTGGNGFLLMNNMEKMGLDPQEIEAIVLSHIHGDHTDGLQPLLNEGIHPTVYVPASFPESFKENVRAYTDLVEVDEPREILPGMHSTGELGMGVREQGLVVETTEGIVVITGCAHPGIVKMVRTAASIVEGEIALVVGGFHLGALQESRIQRIIADFRALGVEQVSPVHCTGETAIAMFAEEYGEDYVQGGVGRVIVVGPVSP